MAEAMIDRTIIRVQDGEGNWQPISLRNASHVQFRDWAALWFHKHLGRWLDLGPIKTTPDEREQTVKLMVEQGFPPLMLAEGGQSNG